jgi:Tol biopolymer transport system component
MSTSIPGDDLTLIGGSAGDRLESWKDIASYFKRDVRTIQRWEKSLGLPIHRFQNSRSGPVFAYKSELETWLVERTKQLDVVFANKDSTRSSSTTLVEGTGVDQAVSRGGVTSTGHAPMPLNAAVAQQSPPWGLCEISNGQDPLLQATQPPDMGQRRRWRRKSTILLVASTLAAAMIGILILRHRFSLGMKPTFRQITTTANENRVTAAALSGDGHQLLFADAQGTIHLHDMDSGYTHTLCAIPDGHLSRIGWFSDGSRVLLSGFIKTTQQFGVWALVLADRKLDILRLGATQAVASPNGNQIAFLQATGSEIWTMKSDGSSSRRVVTDASANAFQTVVWSPDSRRLSYMRSHIVPRRDARGSLSMDTPDIESVYETADAFSGKILTAQPANGLSLPFPLNDGRVFFARNDHSSYDLVEVKTDPSTGRFRGEPRSIALVSKDDVPEVLNVTPNGGRVVVVLHKTLQPDVYVGEIEPRTMGLTHVERLTFNTTKDFPHAWTPDSQSVLFESDRTGDWQIFKQTMGSADAEPVAFGSKWAVMPHVSPDGQWILYLQNPRYVQASDLPTSKRVWSLMRVPIGGGQPQQVLGQNEVEEYECAAPQGKRCVLRSLENGQFVFYELDPIRGKGRELTRVKARHNIFGDWGLSPDGSFVAIPDHDAPRCVFRIVDLDNPDKHETELVVDALPALTAVSWAAGRPGWFISMPLAAGVELRYVDEKGHSSRVWESAVPTWPIASPDGQRLAFVDGSADSNVWMLDR